MAVLVLGGTAEARALAAALVERGVPVTSSLAGRVSTPRLPVGEVRIGGFGGVAGLVAYLREHEVTHVVDATHPFAATMTAHAVEACEEAGVPLVRLARPGWGGHPDAASWTWVPDYGAARSAAEAVLDAGAEEPGTPGPVPFITTGRQTLGHYSSAWAEREVLVRIVEPLDVDPPATWTVVRDRGPYTLEGEVALMREHRVGVLLTKDSGGAYTSAKLDAARELGVPVVVVARPAPPAGLACASDVRGLLDVVGLGARRQV